MNAPFPLKSRNGVKTKDKKIKLLNENSCNAS